MQSENHLVKECVDVLRQGLVLLEQLDDSLYADPTWLPVQSGVGSHFRHCLDFYQSFLTGIRSGRIDYHQRERDLLVERDRLFAMTKFQILIAELLDLPMTDGEMPVMVRLEGDVALPNASSWCQSSVLREMQFLLSHTTHHYALIALMLRLQGFEPDEEFGVAPSTLKYWRQEAACAQ